MALAKDDHHGEESKHSHNNNLSSFLKKGSKVEVSPKEEGFKGSWFEAKVLEPPLNQNSKVKKHRLTLIEYVNLLQDDGVSQLTEKVDCRFIRPLPPLEPQMEVLLETYDVVDAFDRDGWWRGVVAQIDTSLPVPVYMVAFEDPPYVIHFSRRCLRPHWVWNPIRESWSRPSKHKYKPRNVVVENPGLVILKPLMGYLVICAHKNRVFGRIEETDSTNLSRPSKELKAKEYIISAPPLAMLFPSSNKGLQPSLSEPSTLTAPLLLTGETWSHMRWISARKKRSSTNNRRKRPSKFSIESDHDSTSGT